MGQSKLKRVKHISSIVALIGLSNCLAAYSFNSDYQSHNISYITDNPKEVIDQAWQIVFRDFLDSSGLYTVEKWKKVRKKVLASNYADKSEAYDAIRNMLRPKGQTSQNLAAQIIINLVEGGKTLSL